MEPIAMASAAAGVAAVAGVFAWSAMSPSAQLFGPTIRRTRDASTIALTFDDGPNPTATPRLLDIFEKHGARGTFFLIGRNVRAFPNLAREIVARGHAVGNHTETHPNLALLPPSRIARELVNCRTAIADATGRNATWMRPPFGGRGPQLNPIVRRQGFAGVVMWSRWAWDWKPQPAAPVIERLRPVRGGDIVVLHDGDHRVLEGDRGHTVDAVEHWLPRWKDQGLRFVTLDDASFLAG